MEGLDFGAILDEDQIESLFSEQEDTQPEDKKAEEESDDNKNNTTEVDPEGMFEDKPESVGGEDNQGEEEGTPSNKEGTSPDFFSFIANAFAEEGIFPDLDEDTISKIKTAKDFRKAIDDQIKAGLDEQQKRVAEALDNGVEPDRIRQYESIIAYLDSINDDAVNAETEDGEKLRKGLLYRDYMNRGFSEERAKKAITRAFETGTDVEDAKEALESIKTFTKDQYKQLLDEAEKAKEKEEKENEEKAARLKKSILEDNIKLFEEVELDKSIRQKAFDAITKPIYRDKKTGDTYTAIQKMELDNGEEFLAKLGLMYALTDGFKSIDRLVKKKVTKEVKRGFSELENKINTTRRDSRGNLTFASGVDDAESILGKGMKLDL